MSENNMCEGAATSATIEEFSRICRTCLGQQNLRSIFGIIIENLGIANLLSDLLSIKIEKNDFLPSKICSTCMEELLRIHKFKKQCHANDVVLKNLLDKAQISSSKTELDEVVDFRLCNATRANKNFGDLLTSKDASVSNNNIAKHGEVTYKIEELDITDDILCRQTRAGNDLCKDDVLNKETTDIKQHDESIDILNSPKTESTPHDAPVETFTFDKSPHVFNKCGKKFEQEERLLHHKKEHELEKQTVGEPNEKLSCQFCGKSSKHTSSCKVHKMGLRDGSRYLGKKFTKKTGSSQHSKNREIQEDQNSEEVDAEGQMYICYHCKKGFGNKAYLKKHLQWHGKRRFLCSVCGAEFISSYNLRMHSRIHTGERPHVCSVCEKSFTHFTTLIRHRRIHTGQKPYSCEFCGRQFTQRTHLNKHLRLHTGERPYACYLCEKVFIDNSSLTIHVRLHTGDRCFVCPICSKGYYTKSTRRKHMKQVHKVEEEVESPPGQSQVVTLS